MSAIKTTTRQLQRRELLSYAEAATYLGVSERQLRRWAPAGKVPYVRFPGSSRTYFDPAALDAFLAMCTFVPNHS